MESSASVLLVAVRKAGLLLVMCSALLLSFSQAQAQQSLLPGQVRNPGERPLQRDPEQNEEEQAQAGVTQKQALDIARARFPGNIISINEVRLRNGVMRYRIRLDNNGNIITVFVDSRTGAVSRE